MTPICKLECTHCGASNQFYRCARFPVSRWLDKGEGDKRSSLELEPNKKPPANYNAGQCTAHLRFLVTEKVVDFQKQLNQPAIQTRVSDSCLQY